jgi:DNA-dependent protein kinase catalytic subunit
VLYKYLKLALDPQAGLARYDIPKASLQFIASHGVLIKEYMAEDNVWLWETLTYYCKQQNKKLKETGFEALDSFLLQLSAELVNEARDSDKNSDTFSFFFRTFREMIEGSPASSSNSSSNPNTSTSTSSSSSSHHGDLREVSIALKGFGRFAGATRKYLGSFELKRVLSIILNASKRYVGGSEEDTSSSFSTSVNLLDEDESSASLSQQISQLSQSQTSEKSRGKETGAEEAVHYVSSFISAFANIVLVLDEIDDAHIDQVERLINAFLRSFPDMFPHQRKSHFQSISRAFLALSSKPVALQLLLQRVIFKSLYLTTNPSLVTPVASFERKESYLEYQDLWDNLLFPQVPKDLTQLFFTEDIEALTSSIYDQLMYSILKLLQSLDLSYTVAVPKNNGKQSRGEEEEEDLMSVAPSSDVVRLLRSNTPVDMERFLSLIEFARATLPRAQQKLQVRWIYLLGREIITLSNRFPLISGFYKLLTLLLRVCERQDFFAGFTIEIALAEGYNALEEQHRRRQVTPSDPSHQQDSDDEEEGEGEGEGVSNKKPPPSASTPSSAVTQQETRPLCFVLFSKFLREVLIRTQQYKEELLAACIQLVLTSPKQLVDFHLLLPAIRTALRIGRVYTLLANVAMDAIEYWYRVLPESVTPYFSEFMPQLSDYLSVSGDEAVAGGGVEDKESRGSDSDRKQRQQKFKIRAAKGHQLEHIRAQESNAFIELQARILRFLGCVGGENIHLVGAVNLMAPGTESGMAWDITPRIKFMLPFRDMKPEMFLDSFLPRVVELAETSGSRQIKVASCELLHSIVLYMVGTNASSAAGAGAGAAAATGAAAAPKKASVFYKLYQKLFPSLLILATDVEQVGRQLFEPLVFQLIHWFTRNVQSENLETMALLDAIVDSVGHSSNGALRDFAAKCLAEFLKWSLKHISKKQQEKNPFNVKSVLKRLYSLAHHPNPYKRLGCAITFHEIMRIIREEDSLVDMFAFEIVHNVLFSLRLSQHDDLSMETAEKTAAVVRR